MIFISTIGQEIRNHRMRETNLSQAEFAKIVGVSRETISAWESGRKYPKMKHIFFMAEFFHVSLDHITGLEAFFKKELEEN